MIGREGPKKRSTDRKSPGSAELWRKQKKARNAARGKQVWVEPPVMTIDEIDNATLEQLNAQQARRGWQRIPADSPANKES
jgi:hypothetical protein